MPRLTILNTRERKEIRNLVKKQWGCEMKEDFVFLKSQKNKLFSVNKSISRIDIGKLRINTIGMYFGMLDDKNELRLSIESSQLIGPKAKKRVVELSNEQARQWMNGADIDIKSDEPAFVIVKNGNDFLGSGKITKEKLLNFVPKTRRIAT